MRDGEGCTLSDAAKFILRFEVHDPFCDFLPDFVYFDNVYGLFKKPAPEQAFLLDRELELIVDDNSFFRASSCDDYGFKRSELIPVFGKHGISIACASADQNSMCSNDGDQQLLCQLGDENARLVKQVAELQQQLQEATAAPQENDDKPSRRWPWGNHHTEALGHLEVAGQRWWTLFDPTDPTTAPTNEAVADWLVKEHGVAKDRARSIASLLRADGLPHGPRR